MIWGTHKCIVMMSALISSLVYSTSAIEPLIFNPYTLDVFNVRAMYFHKSGSSIYAAACPALRKGFEKNFNKRYSLDHKSLLVREQLHEKYEEVEKIQCEDAFELSIVEQNKTGTSLPNGVHQLKLGYEVFYDESQYPAGFTKSHFYKFGKVSDLFTNNLQRITNVFADLRTPKLDKEITVTIKRSTKNRIVRQNMGFIWLSKIDLEYDIESWSIWKLNHRLHRHADQLQKNVTCDNYDLGNQLYEGKKLDDFYSLENQKQIFDRVRRPELALLATSKSDCRTKRRCLEKYNFVPPYVFQSSTSTVSCTELTTVPIWHEVSKPLLDRLDKFLVAMAQITDRKLLIISGTHEILTLPILGGNKPVKIYLDSENSRIPVPKILYKIVRYRSYPCNLTEATCIYDILIAIHNEPSFEVEDKLCSKDKCPELGWERIQKNLYKSQHIYCCTLDDELKKKLRIKPGKFKSADLDLKHFPFDDEYAGTHDILDRQREFENVMDQLFPTDRPVDWDTIPFLNFKGKDNEIPLPVKEGIENLTPVKNLQEEATKFVKK